MAHSSLGSCPLSRDAAPYLFTCSARQAGTVRRCPTQPLGSWDYAPASCRYRTAAAAPTAVQRSAAKDVLQQGENKKFVDLAQTNDVPREVGE